MEVGAEVNWWGTKKCYECDGAKMINKDELINLNHTPNNEHNVPEYETYQEDFLSENEMQEFAWFDAIIWRICPYCEGTGKEI